MTTAEAERIIRDAVDNAIHAQLVIDYQRSRQERFTDIAKRVGAMHPAAAQRVADRSKP